MILADLKTLLGIAQDDTSQDDLLTLLLAAAIDFTVNWTGNPFSNDTEGNIVLPSGLKPAIASMIGAVMQTGGGGNMGNGTIESESIGPMDQSFRSPSEIWANSTGGANVAPWFALMRPYRRFGFVPSRSSFGG